MQDIVFGDDQRRSGGVADSPDLVEYIRPSFRRETTLVDPVDKLRIHGPSNDSAHLMLQSQYHVLRFPGKDAGCKLRGVAGYAFD